MTAALFVGAAFSLHSIWRAVLVAPFLGILLACALIDARHRIIPNRIVYTSVVLFAAAIATIAVVGSGVSLATAGLGVLAFGGGLLLVAIVAPHGMGMGDVKLAVLMGLVLGSLGWRYVGVSVVLAILAGGVGATVTLLAGGTRKDAIPFGPYLAGGGILSAPQLGRYPLHLVLNPEVLLSLPGRLPVKKAAIHASGPAFTTRWTMLQGSHSASRSPECSSTGQVTTAPNNPPR